MRWQPIGGSRIISIGQYPELPPKALGTSSWFTNFSIPIMPSSRRRCLGCGLQGYIRLHSSDLLAMTGARDLLHRPRRRVMKYRCIAGNRVAHVNPKTAVENFVELGC